MLLQIFCYSYNHHLNNDNPQVTQHIQIGIMSNSSSSMGLRHNASRAHWYVFYVFFIFILFYYINVFFVIVGNLVSIV